jgi:hypothetical protein
MAVNKQRFCEVYYPMAMEGKSALEIGKALGYSGEDKKVAMAVSQRANNLRKELKGIASAMATQQKLNPKEAEKLEAEILAKLPRLKRGRTGVRSAPALDILNAIIAKCDAEDTKKKEKGKK